MSKNNDNNIEEIQKETKYYAQPIQPDEVVNPAGPSTQAITIRGIEKDPPLCGKTEFGGRLEDTALTRKQERMLAAAKVDSMLAVSAPQALQTIYDMMTDESVKDELRYKAATEILDRVLGKATQNVDSHVAGGINIKISPAGGSENNNLDDLSG